MAPTRDSEAPSYLPEPPNSRQFEGGTDTMLSKSRQMIALQAAWEVASIATLLQRLFENGDADDLYLRGLGCRLEGLSSAIMTAVSEHGTGGETDAYRTVIGRGRWVQYVEAEEALK